jgi:hypothetical protein
VPRPFIHIAVQSLPGGNFGAIISQLDLFHQEKKINPSTMTLKKASYVTETPHRFLTVSTERGVKP